VQGRCGLIRAVKAWAKRHWPALRLRSLLLGVLILVAALPGFSAVFLRVYENALVRQTEAELIAQGAVIAALVEESWPGGSKRKLVPAPPPESLSPYSRTAASFRATAAEETFYNPERPTIDLRTSPILPERPPASAASGPADPDAIATAAKVAAVVSETSRTTLASIRMTDRAGVVVYGRQELGGSYASLPEVRAALAGRKMTVLRTNTTYEQRTFLEAFSRGSTLRVHHARPVMVNGRPVGALLLSRSPRGLFIGMYEDRGKIALGVILIFGFLLFLAGLLSRGIAKPIEVLGAATQGGARGVLDVPETPATAAIEIRELYANYRDMAARIEKRSRYLQDFAAAVSHEFKTPIAGIKGALELFGDHGESMSKAQRKRFLANANADADRLAHLVQRLLDLARADMADGIEGVATPLHAPLSRVADAHRVAGLAIILDCPATAPAAAVPAATIEAVVETLIENSRQAGASRIQIQVAAVATAVNVTITDNGTGVPRGDRDRLFDPFFTSRRSEGGSGLGLAIARSLLAASGATIALAQDGEGACFVVVLPVG
jgi:signal transduction histidine kinase